MAWIGVIILDVLKGVFMLFLCLGSMIWGRAKTQAISQPPVNFETPVQPHVSPHGIFGGENDTGTAFFLCTSVFPLIMTPLLNTHSVMY